MKKLLKLQITKGLWSYKANEHTLPVFTQTSRGVCNATNKKGEIVAYQNELFNREAKRQIESVGRIEKICVRYVGGPQKCTLTMNKSISTPYNCAQHMKEMLVRRSALALLDGTTLWDMHRPLESDCELQLLHFQDENPAHANKAFWRTCSFMLGAVASTAFKDDIDVTLHSFPWPNVRSGSFVYDVEISNLDNWQPTTEEMKVLSSEMAKLSHSAFPVERLAISEKLALEMFSANKYKTEQIPTIASQCPDKTITVYRIGKHIDISRGPMVGNTSLLGRCTITAVHKLDTDLGNFYRFQGVALPKGIMVNHFLYSIVEQRAKELNKGKLPWQYESETFHPVRQELEAAG